MDYLLVIIQFCHKSNCIGAPKILSILQKKKYIFIYFLNFTPLFLQSTHISLFILHSLLFK